MTTGGIFDEAIEQLVQALMDWDYSPVFPSNYPSSSGVIVEHGWPDQLLSQIQQTLSGGTGTGTTELDATFQMQEYLISVMDVHSHEVAIRLGNVYGPGTVAGTTRYGVREVPSFLVSCWADQRLGGMDVVRKLAGQVVGCVLFNKNRLSSFVHLRALHPRAAYLEASQLYRFDVTVQGESVVSVDY